VSEPNASRTRFDPLARRSWTDLGPRFASGVVLVIVALAALYVGSYLLAAVAAAVMAGCYREWERMVRLRPVGGFGWTLVALLALSIVLYPAVGPLVCCGLVVATALVAAFGEADARLWRMGGLVFYGLVGIAIMMLRGRAVWFETGVPDIGFWAELFLGAVIWLTDIGAYFTGRQIGGEKLAPGISPGKTWSGAIGGFAIGTLAGLIIWLMVAGASPWWIGLALAAVLSIAGQVGDLLESALKRRFRVKDSGDIIPGHGGLMDRLDSLTFGVLLLTAVGIAHAGAGAVAAGVLQW
jgi:phosphatidate cytidylyltransferase